MKKSVGVGSFSSFHDGGGLVLDQRKSASGHHQSLVLLEHRLGPVGRHLLGGLGGEVLDIVFAKKFPSSGDSLDMRAQFSGEEKSLPKSFRDVPPPAPATSKSARINTPESRSEHGNRRRGLRVLQDCEA